MRVLLKRAVFGLGVLAVLLLAGAWGTRRSWAMGMLVMPPSRAGDHWQQPPGVSAAIEVARDGATLRAWLFEPAGNARGTLLLLHGIRSSKRAQVGAARGHAARGWRVVAVDSRGHGESAGPFLTYGVEEARDLVALVDVLEQRKLLARPLAVVGSSYGAATALQHAAIDDRVAKVVAQAPFASLREVAPAYLHWMLGPAAGLVPAWIVDDLIDGAALDAHFDADAACPRCVAPQIRAAVLLVHSRDDERIPFQHSLAIHDALSCPKEVFLLDGPGHVRIGSNPRVVERVEAWLDAP
jgi:pimeloyl-ACP methyl ester carboxylesterase